HRPSHRQERPQPSEPSSSLQETTSQATGEWESTPHNVSRDRKGAVTQLTESDPISAQAARAHPYPSGYGSRSHPRIRVSLSRPALPTRRISRKWSSERMLKSYRVPRHAAPRASAAHIEAKARSECGRQRDRSPDS